MPLLMNMQVWSIFVVYSALPSARAASTNFSVPGVRDIESKLLIYIKKRNGTSILLLKVENFERLEFEPSSVTVVKLLAPGS